jgi:uncharacterized protein with PIN domain
MTEIEWNRKKKGWIKECNGCSTVYIAKVETWEEACEAMLKYFHHSNGSDGLHSRCLDCNSNTVSRRISNGLSRQEMLLRQDGKCDICEKKIVFTRSWTVSAAVDHDDNTGKIRKILCNNCNTRLPFVEDSEWLRKALKYIKDHKP